jgi:hypothetical protein
VKGRINRKRRKPSLSPICRQTTYDPNALGSLRLKGRSLRIRPSANSPLVRGNFNYGRVMRTCTSHSFVCAVPSGPGPFSDRAPGVVSVLLRDHGLVPNGSGLRGSIAARQISR